MPCQKLKVGRYLAIHDDLIQHFTLELLRFHSHNLKLWKVVPKLSASRQITLPVAQCQEAGIEPGDEYRVFVADGFITIVRKSQDAAKGWLREKSIDVEVSDEESMLDGHRDSAI